MSMELRYEKSDVFIDRAMQSLFNIRSSEKRAGNDQKGQGIHPDTRKRAFKR